MPVMSEEQKRPKRPYKSSRRANGPMLRYLRERAGYSQMELQDVSGVSHTQISRIETGESPGPRTGTMRRLAEALEVDINELYIFDSPESMSSQSDNDGPTMPGGAKTEEHIEVLLDYEEE